MIYQSPDGSTFMAHERLNIVDASDKGRYLPIYSPVAHLALAHALPNPNVHVQTAVCHRKRRWQRSLDDVRPLSLLKSRQRQEPLRPTPSAGRLTRSSRYNALLTPPPPFRNSEIYNHKAIHDEQLAGVEMQTKSDSAVLGYIYEREGAITHETLDRLDGIFATTVFDERTGHFIAARDPMGICPMYWGKGADGSTWFASEMKALHDVCETFEIFPPVRLPSNKLQLSFIHVY